MIYLHELIRQQDKDIPISAETEANLDELLIRLNKVRAAYGKPMIVTSGLRTIKHHLEIYAAKGITDRKKIPMKSNHLYGRAADISDTKHELQEWCVKNEALLEEIGLWMESFVFTKTWVHFQIVPPLSGRRWFMP